MLEYAVVHGENEEAERLRAELKHLGLHNFSRYLGDSHDDILLSYVPNIIA